MKKILSWIVQGLLIFPFPLHASFIEATMGAAVVNDAAATVYNPAALIQVKNPQLIGLGTLAYVHTRFIGQASQLPTGFTQSGISTSLAHYYLPSLYFGIPVTDKVVLGAAIVSNFFSRDIDNNAILRYVQSSNAVQDIDFLPAIGIALTPSFSIGANLNISHVQFDLRPVSGLPGLNIADNQSNNVCSDTSWGGDVGVFFKPRPGTLIGLNYRSAVTYHLRGKSVIVSNPAIISRDYRFIFWTPARSVFSMSQRFTQRFGMIGTLQYIQWDIFRDVNLHNVATLVGGQPVIVPTATIPFRYHNGWVVTLGGLYRIMSTWILRVAGSYIESPGTGRFQVENGDSFSLAVSTGYAINRHISLDAGYAHAFIQQKDINIITPRNRISGINQGYRDAFSLKLTINF